MFLNMVFGFSSSALSGAELSRLLWPHLKGAGSPFPQFTVTFLKKFFFNWRIIAKDLFLSQVGTFVSGHPRAW